MASVSHRATRTSPATHAKRDIGNAILDVAATGCQWRALPRCSPNWNTVYRYHLAWSRDGTWEAIVDRLRALVREREGRDPAPSAGDRGRRSIPGASTVRGSTRHASSDKRLGSMPAASMIWRRCPASTRSGVALSVLGSGMAKDLRGPGPRRSSGRPG
jgi:transposase